MINLNSKVFIAGHNGMLGSSIFRKLKKKGYKKIITVNKKNLDLYSIKISSDKMRIKNINDNSGLNYIERCFKHLVAYTETTFVTY